jgi:hypothetical protein
LDGVKDCQRRDEEGTVLPEWKLTKSTWTVLAKVGFGVSPAALVLVAKPAFELTAIGTDS